MKNLFLAFVCSVTLLACGRYIPATKNVSEVNQYSTAYVKKCAAFLKEVVPPNMHDSGSVLLEQPYKLDSTDCLIYLLDDTATYAPQELAHIRDKKYPSLKKWTKALFSEIPVVSWDTAQKFRFYPKWEFSVPIFLRNDTYCLFYSGYHCGALCGGGSLVLYKKENGRWTEVKYYCLWVS